MNELGELEVMVKKFSASVEKSQKKNPCKLKSTSISVLIDVPCNTFWYHFKSIKGDADSYL